MFFPYFKFITLPYPLVHNPGYIFRTPGFGGRVSGILKPSQMNLMGRLCWVPLVVLKPKINKYFLAV